MRGFSLVELLVVIAIIALLSSVVIAALTQARVRSRDTARIANARQIATALHIHELDKGTFQVANAGYQNTGKGYMGRSGDADYTTSIFSALKSYGYYNASSINDPVYGDGNYYLGLCNPPSSYSLYLKIEQPALQSAPPDIQNGCDGTNALALGFNFIEGVGLGGASTSTGTSTGSTGGTGVTTPVIIGNVGSSMTAGVSTSSSQIALSTATTSSVGNGVVSSMASLPAAVYLGGHTLQRQDGKYVIFNGNGTATMIYDPTTDSFTSGPSAVCSQYINAHSFQRPDGKFEIFPTNSTNTCTYDESTNTFTSSTALPSVALGYGSHSVKLGNGKYLIPALGGASQTTYLFDSSNNTFSVGPNVPSIINGAGANSMLRSDGKFLMLLGNGSMTGIYDPVNNTFASGPGLTSSMSFGGNSIQLPNGIFMIVVGNSNALAFYNPVTNSLTNNGTPALTCTARNGSGVIQRADGTYLIICGNGAVTTNIYNPTTNTISAGPNLPYGPGYGGHFFQRPDGKFVIINGGNTASVALYDAGWIMSGTYTTEDMNDASLNTASTLQFTVGGQGSATVQVKTAPTQSGLSAATYHTVTAGGNIGAASGDQWIKILVTLKRNIPQDPRSPYVWLDEGATRYLRTLTTPTLTNLGITD